MSTVIEFHNHEIGYAGWQREHQHDGFVLTKKGREWALHRAFCDHISSTDADGALYTRSRKLCSTDQRALELEAARGATGRLLVRARPAGHEQGLSRPR